jgi:hypothetical protein
MAIAPAADSLKETRLDLCDESRWHPAANIFPVLGDDELNQLADDIKTNGLLEPVVLMDGLVLDGRNRLLACQKAGVTPRFIEWNGECGDPWDYVLSKGARRRHMTASQKACAAVELLPRLEEKARLRQGARTDLGAILPQGSGRAIELVGDLLNVSPTYVKQAKRLKVEHPDLFAAVRVGEISLQEAKDTTAVHCDITVEYQLPHSPKPITSHWHIDLPDAIDCTPRQLVEEMAKALLKTLTTEGWPLPK